MNKRYMHREPVPINEEAARCAQSMNSFSEYRSGSATAEYNAHVEEATRIAAWQKSRVDPMYHERIDALLEVYCRKMAAHMNHGFQIESRVPSVLIAGPANFPVAKKEKQNQARARHMAEYEHIQGLLDKIKGVGMGGISSDDPKALKKLREKLASLQKAQADMKEINAYYRKHQTCKGCPLLSEDAAERLDVEVTQAYAWEKCPYPSWVLSNNNANIHRVRERIESMEKAAEHPCEGWAFTGGSVVINQDLNRLQILFDEKPDESMRNQLKRNAFKWAPSQKAWQRQLTDNAIRAVRSIKELLPKEA